MNLDALLPVWASADVVITRVFLVRHCHTNQGPPALRPNLFRITPRAALLASIWGHGKSAVFARLQSVVDSLILAALLRLEQVN